MSSFYNNEKWVKVKIYASQNEQHVDKKLKYVIKSLSLSFFAFFQQDVVVQYFLTCRDSIFTV